MNASTEMRKAEELSPARTAVALLRHYLGGRRGLILLAVIALGAGTVLNLSSLVAMGLAPLILALAPCAAMCALGLCMNRMAGKTAPVQSSAAEQDAGPGPSATPSMTHGPDAPAAPAAVRNSGKSA